MGDVSAVQTQIHKPGILQNSHDFANIFKAFIGANYLAVPFDFLQSGLVLGVIGLAIIAGLTDHCCHLIIKCKQEAVSRLHTIHHTPSKIDLEAENGALSKSGEELLEHFESTLTYGDIGQLCMGKVGVILVNIGLCITQLGFCSTYVIYLATTFGSFFPNKAVSTPNMSLNDLPAQQHETQQLYDLNDFSKSTELLSFEAFQSSITSAMNNISEIISNLSSTELYAENSTTSTVYKSTAPPFFVLILFPLPVFIIFAFIRNIRKLGPVSMLANVSLCLGFVLMFLYLLIDIEIYDNIKLINFATFAVFWGHMTAAYEGIGVVVPIESSMKGNRHNFSAFLHGGIILLTFILGAFGIIGYLHYGDSVSQMITENFPDDDSVVIIVKVTVCIGILFTYPLQMFPVIEIFEGILFTPGSVCGPSKENEESAALIGEKPVVETPAGDKPSISNLTVAIAIPQSVSAWKRNTLRTLLVLLTLLIAFLFFDSFAYVSAFVGAVGSSLLAYILPCVFHLKLQWNQLSKGIIVKDLIIIVVGTVGGIISLIVVIQQFVLMRQSEF